jgi:2-polyprenyl-6-methoxyphenol hydroxylase-like FAD-dependent oxidoreductase
MTPNVGQGACRAIEGAVVLGRCLKDGGDVASSVRLYESHRVRRTGAIVKRSRFAGRVVQLENPPLCVLRDAVARKTSARTQLRQLESVVKYEA